MNIQAEAEDAEDQGVRRLLAAMTGQDPRLITLPPRSTGVSLVSAPTGVFDWALAAEGLEEEIRCALGQLGPGARATETMSAYLTLGRAGKALNGFQRGEVERNPEQKTRAFHLEAAAQVAADAVGVNDTRRATGILENALRWVGDAEAEPPKPAIPHSQAAGMPRTEPGNQHSGEHATESPHMPATALKARPPARTPIRGLSAAQAEANRTGKPVTIPAEGGGSDWVVHPSTLR